jgi:phosphoenolpyruvate synthase/pyruvate phosphate dikinase
MPFGTSPLESHRDNTAIKMPRLITGSAIWLTDIDQGDLSLVGGKAFNLARLHALGLHVPLGYCVPTPIFDELARQEPIQAQLINCPKDGSFEQLSTWAHGLRNRIVEVQLPPKIREPILAAFDRLVLETGVPEVAVRSSGIAEDSSRTSFAGQFATFLSVYRNDLLQSIKQCWASPFSPRAIAYSYKLGLPVADQRIAVIVQRMIKATSAGIMFTIEPVTGNASQLVLEAVSGSGEPLVSGRAIPNRFNIDKESCSILESTLAGESVTPVLTYDQIVMIAKSGLFIERAFGWPQDIEWAFENGELYVLQTRPITTHW